MVDYAEEPDELTTPPEETDLFAELDGQRFDLEDALDSLTEVDACVMAAMYTEAKLQRPNVSRKERIEQHLDVIFAELKDWHADIEDAIDKCLLSPSEDTEDD